MDTTQLKNTYKIIQDKLRSCQNEKRNITTRKATKRTLLQESHYVLQNHLVNALTENVTKIKRISLDKDQGALIPIIPNSSSSGGGGIDIKDTLPAQQAHGFTIIKCRGWFINRRVWLQAQGHALNITQAHICCLPNKFIPETAHLNKCSSDGPQHLFLCFDLLPDVRVGDIQSELRAYCSYRQASQPFSSETCAIEWLEDLSWFGKTKNTHCRSHSASKRHCKLISRAMSASSCKILINLIN
ncbi:hypothetical protein BD408DRAFT_416712 [Parasitella parasitica]|nr:hypothetical protein BD408DRAFT_416712 [Parasitella parasitica]